MSAIPLSSEGTRDGATPKQSSSPRMLLRGPATKSPPPNRVPLDPEANTLSPEGPVDATVPRRTAAPPVPPPVPPRGPANELPTSTTSAPDPELFANLRLLAECYEDVQRTRIAISNRLSRADVGDTAKLAMEGPLASMQAAGDALELPLKRALRMACPEAAQWAKTTVGVGEHLTARLIGVIGHPVIAQPYHWEGTGSDRRLVADPAFVRNVAKLWAYCGHGDPTRRKRKGMTAAEAFTLGNPRAKTLVYLMAQRAHMCVGSGANHVALTEVRTPLADTPPTGDGAESAATSKGLSFRRRSPYRDIYDYARIRYAERDWTDAHRHAAALRLVGKSILRDLWQACGGPQ